jgi:nitroimidazol reductase NimA-like FMN-containing flavoprotein (pyridoxamine 5'-phosphate oxidase superfamily)
VRRVPQRAVYERAETEAILDEALVSHVGTIDQEGYPVVIPTLHARLGDWLYIHGSAASRTLREAQRSEICLTATLLDGVVLARSAFHHSVNYRSVVVFGQAERIEQSGDKRRALEAFTEKLVPGRWGDVRLPSEQELRGTAVLRIPLDEASAKVRGGGPVEEEADYDLPVWAGSIGLRLVAGPPEADARLSPGIECPAYVNEFVQAKR